MNHLSKEDYINLLCPKTFEFWLHKHCHIAWRFLWWNWFNLWTGEKSFWLFVKHGFRDWR